MISDKPIVSICCTTFNHEKYIRMCLEGFVMQKTNFPYEILIFDDASTDNTSKIVKEFAQKYKHIKTFIQKQNQWNQQRYGLIDWLFPAAKGRYIALCEGDDYWIDPLKLQKQVDFMENNPGYIICFHDIKNLVNEKFEPDVVIDKRYNNIRNNPITVIDLLEQGNFIHTPSVLFRNIVDKLPMEFRYSAVGDYFLYIILSQGGGFIKKIDEEMAVYRRGVGFYSTMSNFEMKKRVLIYQSCILSYLNDPTLKELLLKKQCSTIQKLKINDFIDFRKIEKYHLLIRWKSLFDLLIIKIKHKLRK